ncbi:MAG: hypothetical protein PHX44_10240 [Sulfurimonas sp.]|uniref:hypothetical protein n=1 Tax=Sulfurimonas sp. TaxID=2022749 RepID=UPI0026366FE4|nr:hypothetical protein [Sulfurimonas sp.]MDD2653413.1 hypothetical protein [Sulfurimonas sp.]MDD3452611.1 hypothetical protein [Sulfurimonas sp.]
MKKLILIVSLISLVYGNEQTTKEPYDLQKDWIYNGCRDVLADKWTGERNLVFGMAVAKKDATLDLLRLMSMRVVNGVDEKSVCKWYLDVATDANFSSTYIKSLADSRFYFLDIVERSAVKDNGESYEKFEDNLQKIRQLFKK